MLRTPWVAFALGAGSLGTVFFFLPFTAQAVVYPLLGVLCFGAVVVGVHIHRPARPGPWALVGGGILLWILGDVAYSIYDLVLGAAPYPSIADGLYLAGYPLVAAGLAVAVRRTGVRDTSAWQDAAIVIIGATLLSWEWLLEPNLVDPDATDAARLLSFAFPAMDLVLLLFVVRLVSGLGRPPAIYLAVAGALGCYLVSDAFYSLQSLNGTYATGGLVDLGWVLSYVATGAVALHPDMVLLTEPGTVVPRTSSRLRQLVLGATALLAPGLLVVQHVWGDHVDVLLIASAATLLFCLTTARGAALLRDVESLAVTLRRREQELHRRATTDALTGLANRTVLLERLEHDAASGAPFCVALLDLDDFKHVNDSRGHDAGDELLLAVSARLTGAAVAGELVARLGGDEFAVVSSASESDLAQRLLGSLASSVSVVGSDVLVRASIGVAASTSCCAPPAELLRNADIAMYASKSAGGGSSVLYRPEMSTQLLAQIEVRRHLAEAVEREEFVTWLQPIVQLATHRLLGFEALARWDRAGQDPDPASWMPEAEESGLVVTVDEQILRRAARQLVEWSRTVPGADRLDLAVNASGRSLREADVAERLLAVLAEEGLPPSRLVLEVTESVLIHEAVGPRLQVLRDAGVRIALDDFGTGWSSLAYLRRFPVDVLKLDRSFVAGLADGSGAEAVPAAVLQLAAALDLEVVAEGVETPEQIHVLRRLGCRVGQGHVLGRPQPPEALTALVRRGCLPNAPFLVALTDLA